MKTATLHFNRSPRSVSSLSVLSTSVASLAIGGDLLEHFGLSSSYPSELHVNCLYGEYNYSFECDSILYWKGVLGSELLEDDFNSLHDSIRVT